MLARQGVRRDRWAQAQIRTPATAARRPGMQSSCAMSLLMSVPNVSEGRDAAVVEAIGHAYEAGGTRVLDTHLDPDHHRSVHTLAGESGHLAAAVANRAQTAIELIHLRAPRG